MAKDSEEKPGTYRPFVEENNIRLPEQINLYKNITIKNDNKIVMLVIDGLGGLPHPQSGRTELETASTPNLDKLALRSVCGFSIPVCHGITPGSAPGHLGLFGYDPLQYTIGRGVLEALGIDLDVRPGDVAARGNFCTIDSGGLITDRRAGRINSDKAAELCALLDGQKFNGIEAIVHPVREHRFVVIFRAGHALSDEVADTDPQQTGVAPLQANPFGPTAQETAAAVNQFLTRAREILAGHEPANMIMLRGFSNIPSLPTMTDIYKLRPAAIAGYPMYRGLAKLAGMDILATGSHIAEEIQTLEDNYALYDFFFVHIKGADSAGEDGDFQRKVGVIEEVDGCLPRILRLKPDVMIVAGDHSTPAVMKSHSWHPVPLLIHSAYCRPDSTTAFSESGCLGGGLGAIPATSIMPLAMANALKLSKYGA
ncbi:MAG: 2,3-bisphosphoglycerate-independent phosphoglycerate mutase [Dehalococcoidaceae bacterium]|nr:2,3-bisphosphoglycerate-independent phosphoglycerate mutase [Dehalococcoidaceae bacterium]